ncbi:MAG: hypothetical protein ABIK98_04285 [Pseudomonadota bacterium]
MNNRKKQAAAIAAVLKYLKAEQEAIAIQAMALPAQAARAVPPLKVWGLGGRQAQMQMRTLMQMKTFK